MDPHDHRPGAVGRARQATPLSQRDRLGEGPSRRAGDPLESAPIINRFGGRRVAAPTPCPYVRPHAAARRHIVTTQVEHAIVAPCRFLETLGAEITWLPVDATGRIGHIRRAITADTILIRVMHANNEVGTIVPIEDCAAIARGHGIRVLARDLSPIADLKAFRDRLWNGLRERFGKGIVLNGHAQERLPNTLNVSCVGRVGSSATLDQWAIITWRTAV